MNIFLETDKNYYSRQILIRFINFNNRTDLHSIYSNGIRRFQSFYVLKNSIYFFCVSKKIFSFQKIIPKKKEGDRYRSESTDFCFIRNFHSGVIYNWWYKPTGKRANVRICQCADVRI